MTTRCKVKPDLLKGVILGSLIWSAGGCGLNPDDGSSAGPSMPPTPTPPATGQPVLSQVETSPSPAPVVDSFREAVNRATSAVAIGQSAQSTADWELAASRWQQAIALMEQVPRDSPNRAQAQVKAEEYRQHLTSAQRRATGGLVPAAAPDAAPPDPPVGLAAQIPIRRRQGGTPVVTVTLGGAKGNQDFPMLFDTGATGTLITAEMAQAVGVTVVGEVQARIADGSVVKLPVGYINVLEMGGLRREQVKVAIGGSQGLLGQDIYGEYGIAIGSHMIHLHQ
ncbi:MAG: retropepsin-like aspartic protease [Cyanobacteria bacterium J06638_6]